MSAHSDDCSLGQKETVLSKFQSQSSRFLAQNHNMELAQYAAMGIGAMLKDFNFFPPFRFFLTALLLLFDLSSDMNFCMNLFSASNSLMAFSLLLNTSTLLFFSICWLYSATSLFTICSFSSLVAFGNIFWIIYN